MSSVLYILGMRAPATWTSDDPWGKTRAGDAHRGRRPPVPALTPPCGPQVLRSHSDVSTNRLNLRPPPSAATSTCLGTPAAPGPLGLLLRGEGPTGAPAVTHEDPKHPVPMLDPAPSVHTLDLQDNHALLPQSASINSLIVFGTSLLHNYQSFAKPQVRACGSNWKHLLRHVLCHMGARLEPSSPGRLGLTGSAARTVRRHAALQPPRP